ncbi:MAG: DedA family protein [Candidatus Pacebacteria bacterium]|nr:DedA family protein [Candidatus Paceibacterota bacterium]
MESFFHNILVWIDASKYILLFLGTIAEGPVVMVASGFLYKLGQFNLLQMYFALMAGDFVADLGWYCLGRFGARSTIFKYGHFFGVTPEVLKKVEGRFLEYHQKILIISKLTMGLGFALVVLIVAGMFKVPFKNYVVLNLIGGFIWTAILITVGYFLGNVYAVVPESAKIVFVAVVLLVAFFGFRFTNDWLRKQEI